MRCSLLGTLALVLSSFLVAAPPKPSGRAKPVALKKLDKKLSDFGLTPRSLCVLKTASGRPSVTFFELAVTPFDKTAADSLELPLDAKAFQAEGYALPGFLFQGADFLGQGKHRQTLALLRLNQTGPEASKDAGRTWVDGEKVGETWVFAFEGETMKVLPADETFTPTSSQAWAVERGAVTRMEAASRPYYLSAVITVAIGRNELHGLLKFPGTSFVIAFRGIRYRDRWVARAQEIQPFNGTLFLAQGGANPNPGLGPLKTEERVVPQIELDDRRLLIGVGPTIQYAQEGDSVEQLRSAVEFDLTRGRKLPDLGAAHVANIQRSLWTRSDEETSFSREAERAYVQAGLPVWFFAPRRETGFEQGGGRTLKPILDRLQRLGARVEYLPVQ